MIKKWDNEFVLPAWKYYIVMIYRHRKEVAKGFLQVIGAFLLGIMLYLFIVLGLSLPIGDSGKSPADRESPNHEIKHNSPYNKPQNLPG